MKYDDIILNEAFNNYKQSETLLIHINIEGICIFRFMKEYNIDEVFHIISLINKQMHECNKEKYSNNRFFNSLIASAINTCYNFMIEKNRDAQNFALNDPPGFIIIQKLIDENPEKNIENFNFHVEFVTSQNITKQQQKESLQRNGPDLIEICDMTIDDIRVLLQK